MGKNMSNVTPSSIGGIGRPYYDRHNDRIKGFFTNTIRAENIEEAKAYLEEARRLRNLHNASRITVRMIVSTEMLPLISQLMNVEALIPLEGRWDGYHIVYMAENSESRCTPRRILEEEERLLFNVLQTTRRKSGEEVMRRVRENGYRIELLREVSPREIEEIVGIYNEVLPSYTFPITPESVRELISSPTSLVAVARDFNDRIVSISIAEVARLETDLGLLTIAELSDEATLRSHRRRGLSQACILLLADELSRNGTDLIYEEARATHVGVNKATVSLGFRYAGRLIQHCVIGGDREIDFESIYEDLNVFYLPRREHGNC